MHTIAQNKLSSAARKNSRRQFDHIHQHLTTWEVLWEAWEIVRRKGGSGGVDRVTVPFIEWGPGPEFYVVALRRELLLRTYRPSRLRRVNITRDDGRQRTLNIPVIKDRIVQTAVKLLLEPIFENDFLPCSFAYRPGQGHHKAIREVHNALNSHKFHWAVVADIHNAFGFVHHADLIELLRRRITDKKIIQLIRSWLKKGKLDWDLSMGIGQGSPIAPLLFNVFLHPLDEWWAYHGPGRYFRYADNFLILLRENESPEHALLLLREGLVEAGYLVLNDNETKVISLDREQFTFLGTNFIRKEVTDYTVTQVYPDSHIYYYVCFSSLSGLGASRRSNPAPAPATMGN